MKDFFSEYGFVILAALVVVALLVMVSPLGTQIKAAIEGLTTQFTTLGNNAITAAITNAGNIK